MVAEPRTLERRARRRHSPVVDAALARKAAEGEAFWAWLAGFVDGEGSIGVSREWDRRKGPEYANLRAALQIANTDRFVIEYIRAAIGTGTISHPPQASERHRRQHSYVLRNQGELERVLSRIAPYLRVKLPQATWTLQFLRNRQMAPGRGRYGKYTNGDHFIHEELRSLNARGPREGDE